MRNTDREGTGFDWSTDSVPWSLCCLQGANVLKIVQGWTWNEACPAFPGTENHESCYKHLPNESTFSTDASTEQVFPRVQSAAYAINKAASAF